MLIAFPTRAVQFKGTGDGLKGGRTQMPVADEITERLTRAFSPDRLEVVNDSHRHAGHAGDDGTGESHFHVTIRAAVFAPMGRVERHRAVHAALGDLNQRVHALALDIGPA